MDEPESSLPYTGGGLAELRTIPEDQWKWEISAYATAACRSLLPHENLVLATPNVRVVYWATEVFRQVFQNGLGEFFATSFDAVPDAIDAMRAIGREDYATALHRLYVEGLHAAARLAETDPHWSPGDMLQDETFGQLLFSPELRIDDQVLSDAIEEFILEHADALL